MLSLRYYKRKDEENLYKVVDRKCFKWYSNGGWWFVGSGNWALHIKMSTDDNWYEISKKEAFIEVL